MQSVLPTLTDETAIVRVVMIETVLRSMAVRAAHEIAWMSGRDGRDRGLRARRRVPLDDLAPAPRESRHLDDVVETYTRAGRALSAALEAAVARSDTDLVARGEELLAHARAWRPK